MHACKPEYLMETAYIKKVKQEQPVLVSTQQLPASAHYFEHHYRSTITDPSNELTGLEIYILHEDTLIYYLYSALNM